MFNFNLKSGRTLLALCIFVLLAAALADFLCFLPRIYPGVHLHQFHLGGKTRNEVSLFPDNMFVTFEGPAGKTEEVPLAELGVFPDKNHLLEAAYSRGRINRWLPDYPGRWDIFKNRDYIPLKFDVDYEILHQRISGLEDTFNSEPRNAFFKVSPDEKSSEMTAEQPGYIVDREELVRQVFKALARTAAPLTVKVPSTEVPPDITACFLREKGIIGLVSSFSTKFNGEKEDRSHNIALAASYLNGQIIPQGRIFSLNAVIGNTTKAKGYREAPVIFGGVLTTGVGGGVCQISSTLYNTVLLADLPVIERHNHRLMVAYLPPGRDATIEYGSKDFMFLNDGEHHILINAVTVEDTLTVRLFGMPTGKEVEITINELAKFPPPVKHRYDPGLATGEEEVDEGAPGYIVEVWKTVYSDGEELKRHIISVDSYMPNPTIIRQGPRQ